jgi:hypothetical protein
MATHLDPTGSEVRGTNRGNVSSSTDLEDSERASFWSHFDGLSEEEVRSRVERNLFDGRTTAFAQQWLSQRETLHLQEDLRAARALAQQAKTIAHESHRLAHEATELAAIAKAGAHVAHETAENSLKEIRAYAANGRLALVISIVALMATAAGVFYK